MNKDFCFNFKENTFWDSNENILSFKGETFSVCIINNLNESKIHNSKDFIIALEEDKNDEEENNQDNIQKMEKIKRKNNSQKNKIIRNNSKLIGKKKKELKMIIKNI